MLKSGASGVWHRVPLLGGLPCPPQLTGKRIHKGLNSVRIHPTGILILATRSLQGGTSGNIVVNISKHCFKQNRLQQACRLTQFSPKLNVCSLLFLFEIGGFSNNSPSFLLLPPFPFPPGTPPSRLCFSLRHFSSCSYGVLSYAPLCKSNFKSVS